MSYDVWLFAPTYACISTKLSLYLVNKALSLHNILVFSFHAYRTRQMSMNGGTKNTDTAQKAIIHQLTTMLSTSKKNVLMVMWHSSVVTVSTGEYFELFMSELFVIYLKRCRKLSGL